MAVWGTRQGAPEWAEDLITDSDDPETMAKARAWATEQGFVNIREWVSDGRIPDFTRTIRRLNKKQVAAVARQLGI